MMTTMITLFDCAGKRASRKRWSGAVIGAALLTLAPGLAAAQTADWPQWGRDPGQSGAAPAIGQPLDSILADVVYDAFVAQETAESFGNLLVHYAVPLLDGGDIYIGPSNRWSQRCPGAPDSARLRRLVRQTSRTPR